MRRAPGVALAKSSTPNGFEDRREESPAGSGRSADVPGLVSPSNFFFWVWKPVVRVSKIRGFRNPEGCRKRKRIRDRSSPSRNETRNTCRDASGRDLLTRDALRAVRVLRASVVLTRSPSTSFFEKSEYVCHGVLRGGLLQGGCQRGSPGFALQERSSQDGRQGAASFRGLRLRHHGG